MRRIYTYSFDVDTPDTLTEAELLSLESDFRAVIMGHALKVGLAELTPFQDPEPAKCDCRQFKNTGGCAHVGFIR